MTDYWFLIDKNAQNLAQIRGELFTRNAIASNNETNMVEVKAWGGGDEILIGIMGGTDSAWRSSLAWLSAPTVIQHGAASDPAIDQFVLEWRAAQAPNFDGNADGQRDSVSQRRAAWQ